MQVFQNRNYATSGEVAYILGVGDKTFRNYVKVKKLSPPTSVDSSNNRNYYSEEYIVEAIVAQMKRRPPEHEQDFLEGAVARVNAAATLSTEFKQSVLTVLKEKNVWPRLDPTEETSADNE